MSRNQCWNRIVFLMCCLCWGGAAKAFPETIRHGYVHCSACHLSPGGGGLLTNYGRSLSRELLSTWGAEKEEAPFFGMVQLPESQREQIFVGGDVRYLTQVQETTGSKTLHSFLMQAQLRVGMIWESFKFLASIGQIQNPVQSSKVRPVSPEYFLVWNLKEDLFLRAGRFEPIYGLRMPDHNLWTKADLGFVPWAERDTIEVGYEGEKQMVVLSGFQSTSTVPTSDQATGYSGSLYYTFQDSSKIGLSGMNREGQGSRFRSLSIHGIISHSDTLYSMFEISRLAIQGEQKDVAFVRLAQEWKKGFTPYLQLQQRRDHSQSRSNASKGGIGVTWLPRPHWEFSVNFERLQKNERATDTANVLAHIYF